jgi:hypothetical protein
MKLELPILWFLVFNYRGDRKEIQKKYWRKKYGTDGSNVGL